MTTLRSKIIRLAHEKPALRPVLLPLLQESSTKRAMYDDDEVVDKPSFPKPGTDAHKLFRKLQALFVRQGLEPRRGREGDFKWRWDYSGRGMFGKMSSVAVDIQYGPDEPVGKAMIRAGMSYDRMGYDWVYYTKW